MARRSSGTGFTLVELIVTLVIIGALAAVSAPIFFTTQTFQQQGFLNEARATVRYAQKLAVASGCPIQVAVATNTISLSRAATSGACAAGPYATPVADPANPGNPFTRPAPSGVTVSASASPFIFAALGNVVGNSNVTITVNGSPAFVVRGPTGYVR